MSSAPPRVLLYHGFGHRPPAEDPFNLFVSPEAFEEQLRILLRRLRPLDLEGYLHGLDRGWWPARSFLLTIDDAYASAIDVAAPMLAERGVPSVVFVPPALIGESSRWMAEMPAEPLADAPALRRASALGMALGVHGLDHSVLSGMPPESLTEHVEVARRRLARLARVRPESLDAFAYPDGAFDSAVVNAVRDAGYRVAFSVHRGGAGRFSIRRRPVTGRDTAETFRVKLMPGYQALRRAWSFRPRMLRLHRRAG